MKRRGIFGRELAKGAQPPRGWTLAWYEPAQHLAVYFPMPLGWLTRAIRELIWRARLAWHAPNLERREFLEMQRERGEKLKLAEEYSKGYLRGWRECFQAFEEALEEQIGAAWRN